MNSKPVSEADALRTDIEMTRQRMDDTIEALGERMRGRHLIDEAIGFFRNHPEATSQTTTRVKEKFSQTAGKVSESAGAAANAVIETVKQNPLPFLLITAGAAWLAFSASRSRRSEYETDFDDGTRYDPDLHYDRPLDYPGTLAPEAGPLSMNPGADIGNTSGIGNTGGFGSSVYDQSNVGATGATDQESSKLQNMKQAARDKLSGMSEATRNKFQNVKQRASEVSGRVKERASQIGSQVGERTHAIYTTSREHVVHTADEYPVSVGLGCLAAGVLIGLSIPTPSPVNRLAGPTVDRLRNRTRDAGREALQKGKRVVQAATTAAREEAESQGLTMEHLRQGGQAVADRAKEAASSAARGEGGFDDRAGAEPADPSAARPAM